MCGIFGVISYKNSLPSNNRVDHIKQVVVDLLLAAEIRGTDASGIFVTAQGGAALYKNDIRGSKIPEMNKFHYALNRINTVSRLKSVIGHTRSQTKGAHIFNVNNHPIIINNIVGVHNGVITNDDIVFGQYKERIKRKGQVDSEIIFQLIEFYLSKNISSVRAVKKTAEKLRGTYACAFVDANDSNYVTLFKNTGYATTVLRCYSKLQLILFASTTAILDNAVRNNSYFDKDLISKEIDLESDSGIMISTVNGSMYKFKIESNKYYEHDANLMRHACSGYGWGQI